MLTPAQYTTLKTDINADPVMSIMPLGGDAAYNIAQIYNGPPAADWYVWATNAPTQAIFDAIDWSKFTPVDAADGTAIQTNRLLTIQTKQMNLQNMTVGKDSINAAKPNIRTGIKDAVIQLPSGVSGAMVTAGGAAGVNVLAAMVRKATRFEKLFSTGTGTVASPATMVVEGSLSPNDVDEARK